MKTQTKFLAGLFIILLLGILFYSFLAIEKNPTISFQNAKSIATSQVSDLFSGREWNYVDGILLYDYKGNPARYYFLFVQEDSNILVNSFEELRTLIPNISKCNEDNFCGNNFATLSVRAYENPTGRSDRSVITRHYGWIPFFISDRIEIEEEVLRNYPGKKFGREIVFTESTLEPVYYSLVDKSEDITPRKLRGDTLIIKPDGTGNYGLSTISEFLKGTKKIAKEMEGARYA